MINNLHGRALRIELHDYISYFETRPHKSIDISSHNGNIQTLMIEIYKTKNKLASPIMDLMINKRRVSVGKKENCFLWYIIIKLPCTLNYGHFYQNSLSTETQQVFLKATYNNGYVMSVCAVCAKCLNQMYDLSEMLLRSWDFL